MKQATDIQVGATFDFSFFQDKTPRRHLMMMMMMIVDIFSPVVNVKV